MLLVIHLPPGVVMAIINACADQSNYYEPGSQKRSQETLLAKADQRVGPGGPGPPFVRDFFFFCKRVSDGTSSYVT